MIEAFSLKQTNATIASFSIAAKNVPHLPSPEKNVPGAIMPPPPPTHHVQHSHPHTATTKNIPGNIPQGGLITKHIPFSPTCTCYQSDCATTSTYEALVAYRLDADLGSRFLNNFNCVFVFVCGNILNFSFV